jgi:RNA polymerase sigma-70 factor (ECF subfamily)
VTVTVADFVTLLPDDSLRTGAGLEPAGRESPEVRALVDQARAGSADAFGRLVTLHERAVFRAALAALGSHADAEDAAQDAFVMAWRKLAAFRGDAQFRTWLLTIVWRKALDRRRRRARWWLRLAPVVVAPDDRAAPDPLADVAERSANPEARAIASDAASRVRAEIARLSPRLRDTLLLAASGEHSYDEIGAMLGIPLGTVKWRVAEARRLLKARCEGGPA